MIERWVSLEQWRSEDLQRQCALFYRQPDWAKKKAEKPKPEPPANPEPEPEPELPW